MMKENKFISGKELSKNLDDEILNQSKILKKNLKSKTNSFDFNSQVVYV